MSARCRTLRVAHALSVVAGRGGCSRQRALSRPEDKKYIPPDRTDISGSSAFNLRSIRDLLVLTCDREAKSSDGLLSVSSRDIASSSRLHQIIACTSAGSMPPGRLRTSLFVFVEHPEVEPTNNCSERNVRREAEIRKGGRTSKTPAGAKRRGVIMTVLASLRTRFARFTLGGRGPGRPDQPRSGTAGNRRSDGPAGPLRLQQHGGPSVPSQRPQRESRPSPAAGHCHGRPE
jgi:hypothetical protein